MLGVLSDSDRPGAELRGQLDRFGLHFPFASVVSSLDLSETKPHPLGYRTALEEMGLRAEEVAFVGHDTLELAGAAACGLGTIAFNFDAEAKADVFIARFEELLDVVSQTQPPYAAAG